LVRVFGRSSLSAGCVGLIVGMGLLALGLADSSLGLVISGGVVAGLSQGLSFRSGLTGVTESAPAAQRGEVASSFFVVAYVAISLPVIGVGILAESAGLRTAGLVFTAAVAAIAATVLVLLTRSDDRKA
jgi:hypothetical protein